MNALLYASDGSTSKEAALPKELFGVTVNQQLLAQSVRVYLANQREGSAKTKTRGEVEGSTRKIYRQKGTGKARHGSIRAPIFVGGGIVFGPVTRDYHLSMSKKMKRLALRSALSEKLRDTVLVDNLEAIEPKTKNVSGVFARMGLTGSVLLIVSRGSAQLIRAARNLSKVDIIRAQDLFPYTLLNHKHIVFTKQALAESVEHFS